MLSVYTCDGRSLFLAAKNFLIKAGYFGTLTHDCCSVPARSRHVHFLTRRMVVHCRRRHARALYKGQGGTVAHVTTFLKTRE